MTYSDKYHYAINVAGTFDYNCRKDIVHDAWIKYVSHTGVDLFQAPLTNFKNYCYKIIRTCFYKWYYKERKGPRYQYFSPDELSSGIVAPDEALFAKDLYQILENKLLEEGSVYRGTESKGNTNVNRLQDVFRLRSNGYTGTDIADELGISNTLVTWYNKKINMLTNPINGSRLKITKQISLGTWEKKIDKDDYEMDDENEFYQVYRHKESKDGLLVKLPTAKLNPYIK